MMKFMVLAVLLFWMIRRWLPVRGLKYIDAHELYKVMKNNPGTLVILDVRDQGDYIAEHIAGAVNISVGRLPHVRIDAFSAEDEIVMVADSKYQSKKAARILFKRGFHRLIHVNGGMRAWNQQGRYQESAECRVCCRSGH